MDKLLKSLETEVPVFSARDGGKRLSDFYKAHPLAAKVFEQSHANEDYLGIKKEEINKFFETLAPLAEDVYPIIADMYNKAITLNKPLQKGEDPSKMTTSHIWLANRIMITAMLLAMDEEMKAVDSGRHAEKLKEMEIVGRIEGVNKDQIVKAVICKLTFENLYSGLSMAMSEFMSDIFPEPKGKSSEDTRN